ncbi:MAG: hypothetical protein ACTSRP_17335 [Candidatus Helarchaeota archaeon]
MTFNPLDELVNEIKSKMKAILSDEPYIAILDSRNKYYYFDEKLNEKKEIIEDFNKSLTIDIGQYSLPISAPLGFFRISDDLIFVIFLETGQAGNILLFQGIVKNYTQKIIEYIENIQMMAEVEARAYKIIRLRKRKKPKDYVEIVCPLLRQQYMDKKFTYNEGLVLKMCDGTKTISEIIKSVKLPKDEIISIINTYKSKGWIEFITKGDVEDVYLMGTTEEIGATGEDIELYPVLLEKYRDRKFSFDEGQIIQFCDGKHNIKQISEMTKKSETEVLEVINKYQLKGWLDVLQNPL